MNRDPIFRQKLRLLDDGGHSLRQDLLNSTPPDARVFVYTTAPAVAYPAVGAPAVVVLQTIVPATMLMVIQKWAVLHSGGGFIDGGGTIIWGLFINGGAVEGLNDIESQIGSMTGVEDLGVVANENDLVQVMVQTAGAGAPANTATMARFKGFMYPLEKARRKDKERWQG